MGCFGWLLKLRVDTLKPFLARGLPMLTFPWLRSYKISIAFLYSVLHTKIFLLKPTVLLITLFPLAASSDQRTYYIPQYVGL